MFNFRGKRGARAVAHGTVRTDGEPRSEGTKARGGIVRVPIIAVEPSRDEWSSRMAGIREASEEKSCHTSKPSSSQIS